MPSAEQEAYKARTGSYASSLSELRGTGPYSSPSSSRTTTQKTAQGQTVTITHAGAGKVALTPAQIESENQRMREEIDKYGYYTPLEYNASSDEYYQTAPDISPSKYLQTPSRKTPAYMFEPSASWQTPTAAKKQMEARIASGEYTTQNIGYKTEVGVAGAGGVAYYGDDVLLNSLIQKKEPKGVGVSPKQRELQTESIIADMVFEGYVKPPKSTEKGFELEFTEAGQQVKPYLLSKLNQTVPDYWLMQGTASSLIFSGMPYTTTTTIEGGKTTKVTTDYYGKEIERTVEGEIGALAGPSSGKSIAGFNPFENQPVVHPFVGKAWEKTGYGIDMGVSNLATGSWNPIMALSARTQTGERILSKNELLPGFTITTTEQKQAPAEPTAMERWLTPLDKSIEDSILGWGGVAYRKIKSDLDKVDTSKLGLDPIPNLRLFSESQRFGIRLSVEAARSDFFSNTVESFLTAPETGAKLAVRVAPAFGISAKGWLGMPLNPLEKEYAQTAVAYGTLAGVGLTTYALGFAGSARTGTFIPQAALGTSTLVKTILPGYLGMNLWGAPAEVASRGVSGFIASRKMPKQIELIQLEEPQGGTFTSMSRYRTDVGQLIPDEYARISPDKYSVFSGKSSLVPDDELASVYGGQGIVQGEPGKFVGIGKGTLTKDFDMYGYNVRGFSIDSVGFQLREGKAMVGFDIPATVSNTAKGPVYYPRSDVELLVLGKGTPSYSSTYGLVRDATNFEKMGAEGFMKNSPLLNDWMISGEGTTKAVGGMVVVGSPYSGKAYTIPLEGIIIPIEPAIKTTAGAGIRRGMGIVGPSAGGFMSGGTSGGGSVLMKTKFLTLPKISEGTIGATMKAIVASEKTAQAGVDIGKLMAGTIGGAGIVSAITKPTTTSFEITRTTPKIKQEGIFRQMPKTATATNTRITSKSIMSQLSKPALRISEVQERAVKQPQAQIVKLTSITIPKTAQNPITDVSSGQIEIPKLADIGLTATATSTIITGIVIPPPPPPPPPPPGKGGGLPWELGFAGGSSRGLSTKRKLPTKYKPSLLGIVTGYKIKKAPKFVSGAEWARGIVSGGKKKRKKGKRRK